jgi:catechol 2,3-dioxygenase-like lactoylglutathione lyase family enzyme
MLSALDHIALIVNDLDAAIAQYETLLGVKPNWRGAATGATHAWFQLGNTALDIVAPTGASPDADRLRARLANGGEGLWAVAYATPEMERTRRLFARRGLPSSEVRTIGSIDSGGASRAWPTSVIDPQTTHGTLTLLIDEQDVAPWPRAEFTVDRASAIGGLDHLVIATPNPERAAALYGARLGLEMTLDRTNPEWGMRLMFFRCGDLIVEIAHTLKAGVSDGPDKAWGLSWRAFDVAATHARLEAARFDVSEVRPGRKPGTRVFTVRDRTCGVPTLVLGQ